MLLGHSTFALRGLPARAARSTGCELAGVTASRQGPCRWQTCGAQPRPEDGFDDLPVVGEASGRQPEEALIKSLEQVSSQQGFGDRRRNTLVLGSDKRISAWAKLDKKVNKYPGKRVFKAVGEGGDNFASSMQAAVEQTLGPLPPDVIQQRLSSHQRFLSVTIGPVTVDNSNQVVEVYQRMKADTRLRFCM